MSENSRPAWPELPLDEWRDTHQTLHLWTQIVGKVKLALSKPENHWWHVALSVSSKGLTTGPIRMPILRFRLTSILSNISWWSPPVRAGKRR